MTRSIRCVSVIAITIGVWFFGMPAPVAAQPQCAVPTFGLPRTAGTAGQFPFRIVSADFNGDARPDVATAGQDGAAVLLGDGAGAFGPATFFARPDALDVVAADFNGDGDIDLAVSWKQPGPGGTVVGAIDVRLGDGTGGFGPPASFAAGAEPKAMVVMDFDANGTVDIAAADLAGRRMLVFSGNGGGGFAVPINVPLVGAPNAITFGHFNGDTHVDLGLGLLDEIALNGDALVSVLGNGSGGFFALPPANAGSVGGLVPTDFNADGNVDMVVVFKDQSPSPRSHMGFFPGDGAGHFAHQGSGQLGFNATDIKEADLDRDGVGDVVVRDVNWEWGGGVLHAHSPRPGAPPAGRATFVLPTQDPAGLALADFDGDGRIDVVTPGATATGNLMVMLNKCGDVADVSVDVVRSPEAPVAGEQITYTITARNAGPDPVEAYLELQLYPGADLRALETTLACARLGTPAPFGGAFLRCDLGSFAPAAPGNEVTVTMRVVARGSGDPVTLLALMRSTVPDPNPADNEVEEITTTLVIGGRDLTVSAAPGGGTLLQWSGGQAQAGYLVRRFVDGVMTTFPEDGVPLSAATTTFTDPSPVSGRSNCYAIAPVNADGTPYGRSGLGCRVPGTASGDDQVTASVKLTPTNRVTVTWAGPSATTGFVFWWRRTDTGETGTISFPATRKIFSTEFTNPTCYVVIAYQQTTQLGNTDMLCAVPGFSTLPQ